MIPRGRFALLCILLSMCEASPPIPEVYGPTVQASTTSYHQEKADALARNKALAKRIARLPSNETYPLEYRISIKPYFPAHGVTFDPSRNFTFDGYAQIKVSATMPTYSFKVNMNQLNVSSVTVTNASGSQMTISRTDFDTAKQIYTITTSNMITVGSIYYLSFNYTGLINKYTDQGLYKTSYTDAKGVVHWMIATQMEPFSARQVFPSYDEPSYKAIFYMTVTYPTTQKVLGNMMESTPVDMGNGWGRVQFPPTPRMSSYLIAFAVGPFVSKSYVNPAGTLVRAWGWPGQEDYLSFQVKNSGDCLYQMGLYTNFTYPLPKSDQLGLPEFIAGAMENWGLVVYKYQFIAYNPEVQTTMDMESAAYVACHELSHQWFGDLLTTAWWDDLFLNEGMATYFMWHSQMMVYPEQFDFLDAYMIHYLERTAFPVDQDPDNSYPVVNPNGPNFGGITYGKGMGMIRMLEDTLGADVLQAGLRLYIQRHQYGNVNHEDLWAALTEAAQKNNVEDWCGSPLNVSQMMDPWVTQITFPLITVTNNAVVGGAQLDQSPWFNISTLPPSPYYYTWPVPMRMNDYMNLNMTFLEWVDPASGPFGGPCPNGGGHNKDRMVHYAGANWAQGTYARIRYDDIGFDRIMQRIKSDDIPNTMKIGFVADEWNYLLNQDNQGIYPRSYDRILRLVQNIMGAKGTIAKPSYSLFEQVMEPISFLERMFRTHYDSALWTLTFQSLFAPMYTNNSWKTTSRWDTDIFNLYFLPYAVRYDIGDAGNASLALFNTIVDKCADSANGTAWCNPVHPDFRPAVFCGAAKNGGLTAFAHLQMFYITESAQNPYFYEEYQAILQGMACASSVSTIRSYLMLVYNSRNLDARSPLSYLKQNPLAGKALLAFAQTASQQPKILRSAREFDAYMDAMTNLMGSQADVDALVALRSTMSGVLTEALDNIFSTYYMRTHDMLLTRMRFLPNIIRWMYDNYVTIGNTPWLKLVPGDLTVYSYNLTVTPYIPGNAWYPWWQNLTFDGQSSVTFATANQLPVSTVVLNAHRLIIDYDKIMLTVAGDTTPLAINTSLIYKDYQNGMIYIPVASPIQVGVNYTMSFVYTGLIFDRPDEGDDTNYNFYEYNGKKGWIFTTDFEGGPGVRSLLPCFDQPIFKAIWRIKVVHSADMTALSNELDQGMTIDTLGWATTTFAPTPPMSSYLVAICVGHFSSINTVAYDGILVRMWSWSGMERYMDFSLKILNGTVNYMTDTFYYDFPLRKIDAMALPQYTSNAGAMENWGLILGEYNEMILDPDYATAENYALVAEVVSHETVHQWFGDLVTPVWWSWIFLNEGFAQYWFANGINFTMPSQSEYAIDWNRFSVNNIALNFDCIKGIAKPVVSDFPPIFGAEAYYKGSSMLNMMWNAIPPSTLIKGLQSYLKTKAFQNARSDDLWFNIRLACYEDQVFGWDGAVLDVNTWMEQWVTQTSYPIIYATMNQATGYVTYRQQSCINNTQEWIVPITAQDDQGQKTMKWFYGTNGTDPFWTRNSSSFRLDNIGSTSFARILYDDLLWEKVRIHVFHNNKDFDASTKAVLLADAAFFAQKNMAPWDRFFDLSMYLRDETSMAPWTSFLNVFGEILDRFSMMSEYFYVRNYLLNIGTVPYQNYGFKKTGIWAPDVLSERITELMCRIGSQECIANANLLFQNFVRQCQYSKQGTGLCSGIAPEFRKVVYCHGLRKNPSNYTVVRNLYRLHTENNLYFTRDGDNLLNALSCVGDTQTLNDLINDVVYGLIDPRVLKMIAKNGDATEQVLYDYFMKNMDTVMQGTVSFTDFGTAMTWQWSTEEGVQKLQAITSNPNYKYFNSHDQAVLRQLILNVQDNIAWRANTGATIIKWLQNHF